MRTVSIQTRHPYSFLGDTPPGTSSHLRSGGTWHEGLMDYTDGTEEGALRAEAGLSALGAAAGISFRYDQRTNWQPIESQRCVFVRLCVSTDPEEHK